MNKFNAKVSPGFDEVETLLFEDSVQFDGDGLHLVLTDLESLEGSLDSPPEECSSILHECMDQDSGLSLGSSSKYEISSTRPGCGGGNSSRLSVSSSPKDTPSTTEKKIWKVIKSVPVVNTGYGLIRTVVYASKGEKEEVARTVPRAVGGVAEVATYAVAASVVGLTTAATLAATPIIVIAGSTAAVLAAGSAVGQLIGGGGELIVDACTTEGFSNGNADLQEQRVYHRIVKDTAIVGAVYSAARAGVYLGKGNKKEAKMSITQAGFNAVSSTVGVVAGVGIARAASKTAVDTTTKAVSNARWYSPSYVNSLARSGLQKIGIVAIPKEPIPIPPSVLRNLLLKLILSPTTRNIATASTHQLVERMEKCVKRVLSSEDFQNLKLDKESFQKCVRTLRGESNPLRLRLKLEYALNCLTDCCLKLRDTVQDIRVDDELMGIIVSTGQVVLVQAVLVLAAPNLQQMDLRRAEVFKSVADTGVRAAIQYCLELANMFANKSRSRAAANDLREEFRKYEYIPTPVRSYRPHQREDLPFGKRVLCLDGGGIMGLVELQMLENIEHFLKEDLNESTLSIKQYFDYIGGTSTGGLIALILATGHSVTEAKGLYFKLRKTIFQGEKPYSSETFEKLLQDFFGVDAKMEDIRGIRVIVTATHGSVDHLNLKLFTNYDDETKGERIWKVARRTCAAPGFFDPLVENPGDAIQCYYDGGLVANNPTKSVLRYICDEVINGVIVSLGTGKFVDSGSVLPKIRHGLMDKVRMVFNGDLEKLIQLFINQVTKTDGEVVDDAIFLSQLSNASYFRLTPTLPEKILLDETDCSKIFNMMFHTTAFANENRETFREVAHLLCCRDN